MRLFHPKSECFIRNRVYCEKLGVLNSEIMENTAHLLNEIDKKLMILLRDGRTLIGYLRSVDQFANLVLHKAIGKFISFVIVLKISNFFYSREDSRQRQVR